MSSTISKKNIYQSVFFLACILSYWYAYSLISTKNDYIVITKQTIAMSVGIFLAIVSTKLLDLSIKEKDKLVINKRSLLVWVSVFLIQRLFMFYIWNKIQNINKILLIVFIATTFFIILFVTSYFFRVDIKKFSLKINVKMFFSVVFIFLCFFLPYTFISGTIDNIRYYSVFDKNLLCQILDGLKNLIYPSAYEEYLFRGLLISGLLYFNIEKWKVNIIQATIFGLCHISANQSYGFSLKSSILLTSMQILMGYLFGKVFFKTNSLMPVIILHTLVDTL